MPIKIYDISKGYRELFPHKAFVFSGGEVQVSLTPSPELIHDESVGQRAFCINAHITNANEIMELALITDALRREYHPSSLSLIMPYVPYARQVRVMNPGEALGVKVFIDILNTLKFDTVCIADAHSDVTPALINNLILNIPPEELLSLFVAQDSTDVLVAPDAGAIKKVLKVAKHLKLDMVRADKIRNTKTGEITGTVVYSDPIGDRDFLIVDDICDGGRTFIELAKQLRPLTTGKIKLYVTHGIFSKGLDVFNGLIDEIYCPYPFDSELTHPLLKVSNDAGLAI